MFRRLGGNPAGRIVVLALLVVGLAACSDQDRLRSTVTLDSINQGAAIQSDVFSLGKDIEDPRDDYVPEDAISVIFRNVPLDPALTPEPNRPFGDVVITKYRVDFQVPDAELASFGGGMFVRVPTGQTAEAFVTAVPALYKMQPPLVQLIQGGGAGEITGVAFFTFFGEEEQTGDAFTIKTSIVCNFADFSDK